MSKCRSALGVLNAKIEGKGVIINKVTRADGVRVFHIEVPVDKLIDDKDMIVAFQNVVTVDYTPEPVTA